MAVFTVTTTPQLLFKSQGGSANNPSSLGVQVQEGTTGTVYVAFSQADCVSGDSNYISENTSIFSVDMKASNQVWVVCDTGTVNIVYSVLGPN